MPFPVRIPVLLFLVLRFSQIAGFVLVLSEAVLVLVLDQQWRC